MDEKDKNQLLTQHFTQFISDHRKAFMEQVLDRRTRHITVVLENIFQSQNASAAVRTCECMGLQDIHIIEDESSYSRNRKVLKGADKWLDLIRYKEKNRNNTELCFQALHDRGYSILVTDPSTDGLSIEEVPLDKKIALIMGNELHGISDYALTHADQKVRIPMYGFTESLNISVSAAVCLNTLIPPLRQSSLPWQLTNEEKDTIRLQWLRKMVRKSEILEKEFLRSIQ